MLKDSMTPMERSIALSKGLDVDRLPCNPNVANGVARVYGCKISEFNTDGKALAKAQIASYRKFGYDGVRVFTDLFTWAEAMKYLVEELGDEVPCSGGIVGPFTNAFFLVGTEKMTKLMFKDPETVHKWC